MPDPTVTCPLCGSEYPISKELQRLGYRACRKCKRLKPKGKQDERNLKVMEAELCECKRDKASRSR